MSEARVRDLDIIPTLNWGEDWLSAEDVIEALQEQHSTTGLQRFILFFPSTGCFSREFPSLEVFERGAEEFKKIKEAVAPQGIEVGWWLRTSINSGATPGFTREVRADGRLAPYSNCPLCPNLRSRLSQSVALFARIAKPALIFFEDDFTIAAGTAGKGCFCERHLEEFSRREGTTYTRETLAALLEQKTPEALALRRRWQRLMKDSLVGLAQAVRTELDKESPEISIGHMQPGPSDLDGDSTEEIARAFAGKNHTPYVRYWSTLYCVNSAKELPGAFFNPLYKIQHTGGSFRFYHETDTYPHTRFFKSAAFMRAVMGAAYSLGYDGSTFNNAQFCDDQNEEKVYNPMLAAEYPRFNEAHRVAKACRVQGVQVEYDPFYASVYGSQVHWQSCLNEFGIPITTSGGSISFWDGNQARYMDDEAVLKALSGALFLDGTAAKILCDRGFGRYLGVDVPGLLCERPFFMTGDPDAPAFSYDIAAREVIREGFIPESRGRHMTTPYMYAPAGYGNLMKMSVNHPACEVIAEYVSCEREPITVSMTRFENELGGRVVVMGVTLEGNHSHSLLNYRRQKLIQEQMLWCGDETAFVRGDPEVYLIMNEAIEPEKSGFKGMLTLINLGEDALSSVRIHLPARWREAQKIELLKQDGSWQTIDCSLKEGELLVKEGLSYLEPIYLLVK